MIRLKSKNNLCELILHLQKMLCKKILYSQYNEKIYCSNEKNLLFL